MKFARYNYSRPASLVHEATRHRLLIKPTLDWIRSTPVFHQMKKRLGIVVSGVDPIWSDLGFVNGLCHAAACSGDTGLEYNE